MKRGYAHSRSRFFFQFHSNSPNLLVRSKVRHSFCSIPPTKPSKLKSLTAKNAKVRSVSQLRYVHSPLGEKIESFCSHETPKSENVQQYFTIFLSL